MSDKVDKFITGLVGVGVLLFLFLNASKVDTIFGSVATNVPKLVGGIATIGGGNG